jgi:RNA polymerase sigma-70 factor (ECF subfamily)
VIAGLPGIGLGGVFLIACALLTPFIEVWRRARGRRDKQRQRLARRQTGIAVATIAAIVVAYWGMGLLPGRFVGLGALVGLIGTALLVGAVLVGTTVAGSLGGRTGGDGEDFPAMALTRCLSALGSPAILHCSWMPTTEATMGGGSGSLPKVAADEEAGRHGRHQVAFHELLGAAWAGAEWSWRAIHEQIAPLIIGYLKAQGAPEPEDVAGEVFLQIVRDIDSFAGDERSFRAWVMTITHHRLLDERRRVTRRPVVPLPDQSLLNRGPIGDGEGDGLRRLEVTWIEEVLAHLSEEQRQVVLLRTISGLTAAEVGQVMDKTEGAVKALQRRALASMRRRLSPEDLRT